jgi:tripartite-type tricarboxylate transporter receptor subunit TctC
MNKAIRDPLLRMAAALATLMMASTPAWAQFGGSRPLVMKVAYPAGGPADVAARQIQPALQTALGQTVIVDDQPGAGGSIAANAVLGAAGDGRTLLVITGNDLILSPLAMAQVKYKPEAYRLLTPLFPTDFVLVSSAKHNFAGVDDLIEQARARGDKALSFGSWGYGSAPYLVGADFSARSGMRLLDVPYKGASPVMTALLGQEIDLAFVPMAASVLDFIRNGRIRPVGVASLKRNPFLPNVPTLNEGKRVKGFAYSAWAGVFVPTTVPEPVAAKLQAQLVQIVGREDFRRFLAESAALPIEPMNLSAAAEYYRSELDKFRGIAKAIGLKPQ